MWCRRVVIPYSRRDPASHSPVSPSRDFISKSNASCSGDDPLILLYITNKSIWIYPFVKHFTRQTFLRTDRTGFPIDTGQLSTQLSGVY